MCFKYSDSSIVPYSLVHELIIEEFPCEEYYMQMLMDLTRYLADHDFDDVDFELENPAVDDLGLDIKVLYGVEAYFVPDDEIPEGKDGWKKVKPYHAIILTQTQKGLRNLYELISVSHIRYFHKRPRILQSVFEKYREGLILGSACEQGELYRAILHNKPQEKIEKIAKYYDY